MTNGPYREEVLNVVLAQLLHERGVASVPEQILRQAAQGKPRRLPDVLITFQGLRTIIEGKVDDQPGARESVWEAAKARVDEGIAHIAVALLYPASLRDAPFPKLKDRIRSAQLRMALYSETGETGWVDGNLNHLTDLLRRTHGQLAEENVVAAAAETLDEAIKEFAHALNLTPASVDRVAQALGISAAPDNNISESRP